MIRPLDETRRARYQAFLDESVPVSVILAEKKIPLSHLMNYSEGSVIVLDDSQPKQFEIRVGETRVGAGVAVTVGDRMALKITEVADRRALAALVVAAEAEE